MEQKYYKAMFSKSIRSELIVQTLESAIKKRILRFEVSRASSNKSEKPPEPIAIYDKDYETRIEPPKPIYTQGYPSMRSVDPYEREPCQYYQPEQTGRSFQNKFEFPQNTTAFRHNFEAFPQNETGFPQYTAGIPHSDKYDYIGPCCFGVGIGGKDSKTPSCSGIQAHIKPKVPSVEGSCYPPQPCPCCRQYPCCCTGCGPRSPHGNWCIPQVSIRSNLDMGENSVYEVFFRGLMRNAYCVIVK